MAQKKHNELKAGIFVLLALGAGLGVLLWLGASDVFHAHGQKIAFYVPLTQGDLGVGAGSVVKYGGVEIGKIEAVTLDEAGGRTVYTTKITREGVPAIYSNAQANVVSEFIGGAGIVLKPLSSSAKGKIASEADPILLTVGPNSLLRQAEGELGFGETQKTQLQQIIANMDAIALNVNKATTTLAGELAETPEGKTVLCQVKATLSNLQQTSARLLTMSGNLTAETQREDKASLLGKIHQAADNVNVVAGEAAGMAKTIRPDIEKITGKIAQYADKDIADLLGDFRKINTQLLAVLSDLKAVSGTARDVAVLNKHNIDETLVNLKAMSANLSAAAREVRRNPWRLMYTPSEKELRQENTYDTARAFMDGAAKLEDTVARLDALSKKSDEPVKADDPDLLQIRATLKESFAKFKAVEDNLWKELAK
jgi:ABC-type transporter Mla subunit MlaD